MGDKTVSADGETAEEWTLSFHGTAYILCMTYSDRLLTVEVEDEDVGDRWSADFSSQYIEEITLKAGSLKRFSLFATMLSSAFNKSDESVFVDLLTFQDLEVLKARKTGSQPPPTASVRSADNAQKRYIILTYTSKYDRVHYPLPLQFEATPNPPALQRTIRRLRQRLKLLQHGDAPCGEKEKELRQMVSQLRQENTELKHRLRHQSKMGASLDISSSNAAALSSPSRVPQEQAAKRLRKQVDELTKQLLSTAQELEGVKRESAREISRYQQLALGAPQTQISAGRSSSSSRQVSELQLKVQRLQQELRLERMARGLPSRALSSDAHSHSQSPSTRSRGHRTPNQSPSTLFRETASSHSKRAPGSASFRDVPRSGSRAADPPRKQTRSRTPSPSPQAASSRPRRFDSPDSGRSSLSSRHSSSGQRGHPVNKPSKAVAAQRAANESRSPSRLRGTHAPEPSHSLSSKPPSSVKASKSSGREKIIAGEPARREARPPSTPLSISEQLLRTLEEAPPAPVREAPPSPVAPPSAPPAVAPLALASSLLQGEGHRPRKLVGSEASTGAVRRSLDAARPVASSSASLSSGPGEDPEDLAAIDKRIHALSQYLENARKGLVVQTEAKPKA